jgi:hypothetical protein
MRYATITHLPDRAGVRAQIVLGVFEPPPEGLHGLLTGWSEGGLWIVEVWVNQAAHDRHVTERLYPALRQAGQRLGDDLTHVAVHVDRLYWTPCQSEGRAG